MYKKISQYSVKSIISIDITVARIYSVDQQKFVYQIINFDLYEFLIDNLLPSNFDASGNIVAKTQAELDYFYELIEDFYKL